MNWKTSSLAAALVALLGVSTFGADATDLSAKRTFTGTVTYLAGGQIQFGFNDSHRGWVNYSARPGSIFRGPVRDIDGKIIREGDMIMHIADQYRVAMVDQAKALLKLAEVNYNYDKWQYEMVKKLEPTSAASQMQVQQGAQAYFGAIASLESARAVLIQAQQLLDVCSYRAQYDGIVDTVMVPAGYLAGEEPVMKIYEMNPIGVSVALDSKTIGEMSYNTPVTITPSRHGKPVGNIHGITIYTGTGLTFEVVNQLLPPPVEAEGLPIFENWGAAVYLNNDAQPGIFTAKPIKMLYKRCLVKKGNDYFAWRVDGVKNTLPGTGMNYISTVTLVPITLGKIQKLIDNNTVMVEITNTDNDIAEGDTFLNAEIVPADLKNGDKVCLYKPIYTFMNGDVVTVEIGPNPATIK